METHQGGNHAVEGICNHKSRRCQMLPVAARPANVSRLALQAVRCFALPPASAAAHIAALTELSKPAATSDDHQHIKPETADWGCAVLKAAEEVLGGFVEQVNLTHC